MDMEAAHAHGGSRQYTLTWVYLLALTAVEVVLAYMQAFSTLAMLVILMFLSIVKAGLIMAYFMHLRSERMSLIVSLIPVGAIVMGLLFAFFPDSFRLLESRMR
jgi:caa(3)-type oxidase subunit IV